MNAARILEILQEEMTVQEDASNRCYTCYTTIKVEATTANPLRAEEGWRVEIHRSYAA